MIRTQQPGPGEIVAPGLETRPRPRPEGGYPLDPTRRENTVPTPTLVWDPKKRALVPVK